MAQKTIKTATLLSKDRADINDNFTELYTTTSGMTAAELSTLDKVANSFTTATTPASGTCAVQLVFKDADGATLAQIFSGIGYISTVAGVPSTAVTSVATLTNGTVHTLITGKVFHFATSAAGLLGITVTAGAGTYYISFQLPNGKVVTSSAIVVNA